jgi:muconolactone delta-isomerase
MYVLASGTFTERDKLAPLLTDEVAKVHELRDRGIIPRPYRRADGSGVELLLDVSSVEDAREQLSQLPFAKAGLLGFDFTELVEL